MANPIKRAVDDADFLIRGERYEGALVQLLVAVAASSTKMFPAGTSSIDSPAIKPGKFKEMGDREKFKRFLGPRIRKLLFKDPFGPEDGRHSALMRFTQGSPDPEEVLYEQYRNAMIHEGKLPENIRFSKEIEVANSICMSFGPSGVTFTSGLLTLLRQAVVEAPINGGEFGITHYRVVPRAGLEFAELKNSLAAEFQTTPGRVSVLLSILQEIGPSSVTASDVSLRKLYRAASGSQNASGLQTSFYGPAICDANGELTDHGLSLSRRLLEACDFVNIAT